jgi:hypothetical protein
VIPFLLSILVISNPEPLLRGVLNVLGLLAVVRALTVPLIELGLPEAIGRVVTYPSAELQCDIAVLFVILFRENRPESGVFEVLIDAFYIQAQQWAEKHGLMACREHAMQCLTLIVLDDTEMPIQLIQDLAEFALSMVDPANGGRLASLACVVLTQVLRSGSIDLPELVEIFQRTWAVIEGSTAAALRLQIRALKIATEVPDEVADCVSWEGVRAILVSDDPELQFLCAHTVERMMSWGVAFIDKLFESEVIGVVAALLDPDAPYKTRYFCTLTIMHVFSGGRREQEAALLENPVVAAYLGFLEQIDEEAVPKCIEAFAYAVKQHRRIHPADDLAGHFAEIGVLDRLESLSQSA